MASFNNYSKIALCFVLPQIVVTLVFFIWPAGMAIFQSLFFSDAFGIHNWFAGAGNFIDLFQQKVYAKAFIVTLEISLAVTILTMTFGLMLAVIVNYRQKSQRFYKSLLLWPYAVAPAVAAILWRFLFHPTMGWLTGILQWFGMDWNYMSNPRQALSLVILTASWQQFSYNFLFFFAAIKLIPQSLIDAAIIDGASPWKRFWQIVFPLLSPTTFFLLTMNLIYSFFDTFGIIHILTKGGPENSTTTLIYKVYEDGFVAMNPGSSAAQSVILMLIIITLTLLQFQYIEKRVHYE